MNKIMLNRLFKETITNWLFTVAIIFNAFNPVPCFRTPFSRGTKERRPSVNCTEVTKAKIKYILLYNDMIAAEELAVDCWHIDCMSSEGPGHRPVHLLLCSNHPRSTLHYFKRPGANWPSWGVAIRGYPKLTFFLSKSILFMYNSIIQNIHQKNTKLYNVML